MKLILMCMITLIASAHEPQEINIKNFAANLDEFAFRKSQYVQRERLIKEMTTLSYGNGIDIYVFIDPSCKYSKNLILSNKLDNYRVNIILMDLTTYEKSKYLISYIMQNPTKNRFFEVIEEKNQEIMKMVSEKKKEQDKKIEEFLQYVKLSGTPTITDYAGREITLTDGDYEFAR